MNENMVRTLAPIHRSLRYPQSDVAVVLFDIKAAFPSLGWEWIWELNGRDAQSCLAYLGAARSFTRERRPVSSLAAS